MSLIFDTKNFVVESFETSHVTRTDGENIRIKIKDDSITDRTKLNPVQAIEAIQLTMIVGEALETTMNKRGIPVVKVNYYDMGNWVYKSGKNPIFHYHIYSRSKNAVKQPIPEAVYLPDRSTGFYSGFEPLNTDDVQAIREEILKLFTQKKYQDYNWHL
jgi:hypothetical protein